MRPEKEFDTGLMSGRRYGGETLNKPLNNRETMVIEALSDLRKTLEFAEDMGNLEYVDGSDQDLEIGALYELSLEENADRHHRWLLDRLYRSDPRSKSPRGARAHQ